jgi:hypothetical protein
MASNTHSFNDFNILAAYPFRAYLTAVHNLFTYVVYTPIRKLHIDRITNVYLKSGLSSQHSGRLRFHSRLRGRIS